ncbi:MAG TPA: HupE/UreJ family protein, partial [Thermoanaerobaculia bacterium]|nr:HupE/UreJ family protein [Thermoanaerobaculia bacterium]
PPQTSGKTSPDALLEELRAFSLLSFDGRRAKPSKTEVTKAAGGKLAVTRLRLTGRTPSEVSRFTFANGAITGFFVLKLRNEGQKSPAMQWVEGGKESAPFPLDGAVVPPSRLDIIETYLGLGYTHILPRGLDHVLFVLGIFLLAAELRPVLWQVTAFTVAHTITLALTIYGVVSLPSSVVEPLIALSIVCVAVENVFTKRLHAWRPAVVFVFGLLHGMGFAGVLGQIGLPRSEFVPALLAFNVGVEGGQLTVILAAFLCFGLRFRREPWYRRRVVVPASLAIAAVGFYWSIQRVLFAT